MILKRILAACLALVIITGVILLTMPSGATGNPGNPAEPANTASPAGPAGPGQGNEPKQVPATIPGLFNEMLEKIRQSDKIKSDGKTYPVISINAIAVADEIPEGGSLPVVRDRETLLKLLLDRGALYDNSYLYRNYNKADVPEEANDVFTDSAGAIAESVPSASPPAAPPNEAPDMDVPLAESESGGGAYSETNEQVACVSEGDIVKTDGKYIYALSPSSGALRIIRANGAALETVSRITLNGVWVDEFYLIGNDRLAVVGGENIRLEPPVTIDDSAVSADVKIAPEADYGYWYHNDFTTLIVYDISDRAAPAELRRVSMDGSKVSTRVIDGIVYLVTNKYMWGVPYDQADSQAILPYCRDTKAGEAFEPVGLDRIYYIPDTPDANYLLIGAIDVYGGEPLQPDAYLGAGSTLYMSRNAMYITKYRHEETFTNEFGRGIWSVWSEKTDILRFAINGTSVAYAGMGTVDGSPINQYSMDEYKGHFRIATTDWGTGTYVTILDASDMKTVGRTEPLEPNERMQSMRFMGDVGYVVTFQNTDPLFTIDLSDPVSPKVMGELKIPGFSQYLHPVGNGLLLGIGRDTQEIYTRDAKGVETVVGFRDVGMKVSLFDVSDPYNPKEIDVLALGEGWAEVSGNPRALMCDPARSLYGFTTESWNNRGVWSFTAQILRVENGRLSIAAALNTGYQYGMYGSRLCFIGDTLYFVHDTGITVYDYNSFKQLATFSY